ncbi:MAG: class I SAM-dependent methyltransferase, partial [Planctomycetes bacterium]|nr:class I SAM-dependent methyltransferase [Planctomycetota bacterium]
MRRLTLSILIGVICTGSAIALDATQILADSGVKGGIIVHVGCDEPSRLAELRADKAYVVHGLDIDATKVARAREFLLARNINGPVSTAVFDGAKLPYIDNLVNLVIAERPGLLTKQEALRVLAPLGVAWIGGRKIVKPWPNGIDEWPQYLRDSDN